MDSSRFHGSEKPGQPISKRIFNLSGRFFGFSSVRAVQLELSCDPGELGGGYVAVNGTTAHCEAGGVAKMSIRCRPVDDVGLA